MPSISAPLSALDAYGTGMSVIANNVANVNTDNFQPSRTRYMDTPDNGGVQIGEIRRGTTAAAADTHADETRMDEARADETRDEARAASNTQIEREFTESIITEHAYAANAAMVRSYEDALGTIIDMAV